MIHARPRTRLTFTALTCVSLIAFSTPFAANAQRYMPNLDTRLDRIEQQLQQINASPAAPVVPANANNSLSTLQVELSQIQEELRKIRGGIEENRFALEKMQRDNKLASEDNEYRLRALEEKISTGPGALGDANTMAQPQESAATAPANVPEINTPVAVAATQAEDEAKKKAVVATPSPATPPAADGSTDPREHYDYAVSLIEEKRWERARDSFERFIDAHGDHWLVPNAYYWIGETYYVNSDFVTAADRFRVGFEANPDSIKAPSNLYKLAKSLIHLDNHKDACIVLKQIQKRYAERNPEVAGLSFETEKANDCARHLAE